MVKKTFLTRQPLYFLYWNDLRLSTSHDVISYSLDCLLREFDDVFPNVLPHDPPLLRGINHHIDLIPSAYLHSRSPYMSNLEQTNEIEKQVQKL